MRKLQVRNEAVRVIEDRTEEEIEAILDRTDIVNSDEIYTRYVFPDGSSIVDHKYRAYGIGVHEDRLAQAERLTSKGRYSYPAWSGWVDGFGSADECAQWPYGWHEST